MANNVHFSTQVPKIYVPSLSVPKLPAPRLWGKTLPTPFKSTVDYPGIERRHVKDLGDIWLGNPITGTRQLRETLEDNDTDWLVYVPLLNRVVGTGLLVKERALEPLMEGKPGVAFINTLESFGNSLDILSNPVKSLMPWTGGGSSTDLLKSMGWIEDSYREVYQWNTGNFALDIIGETISDPLNWISYGQKQAVKLGTDSLAELTTNITKVLSRNIDEVGMSLIKDETIAELAADVATKSADDTTKVIENFIDNINRSKQLLINELTKTNFKYKDLDLIRNQIKSLTLSSNQIDDITQSIVNLRLANKYSWYKSIVKTLQYGKDFDEFLLKAAFGTSPMLGVPKLIYDKIKDPFLRPMLQKIRLRRTNNLTKPVRHLVTELKDDIKYIRTNNKAYYKNTYALFNDIMKDYDISVDDLINWYVKKLHNTDPINFTEESFNNEFKKYLLKRMPKLEALVNPYSLNKNLDYIVAGVKETAQVKGILPEQLDEFISGIENCSLVEFLMTELYTQDQYSRVLDEADLFWNTAKGKAYTTPESKLYYIKNVLLKDAGYSKGNLLEFLKNLHDTNLEEYTRLLSTMSYVGLTLDNIQETFSLLNMIHEDPTNTFLKNKLRELLKTSKIGVPITKDLAELNYKTMVKRMQEMQKRSLKTVFDDPEKNAAFFNKLADTSEKRRVIERNIKLNVYSSVEEYNELHKPMLKLFREEMNIRDESVTHYFTDLDILKNVINNEYKVGDLRFYGYELRYDLDAIRDGFKVGMRNTKDGVIHINLDAMREIYERQGWKNPLRSAPLNYDFKSLDDFITFSLYHERAHDVIRRFANEPVYKYETRLNEWALKQYLATKTSKETKDLIAGIEDYIDYYVEQLEVLDPTSFKDIRALPIDVLRVFVDKANNLKELIKAADPKEFQLVLEVVQSRAPKAYKMLSTVYDIMSKEPIDYVVADIKSLLKTGQDLFVYEEVNAGQVIDINRMLVDEYISQSEVYKELSQMTSPLRKSIMNLLNTGGDTQWILNFRKLLTTIDNNNNLVDLLNYAPIVNFSDNKEFNKYLQGMLYNIVWKHRDTYGIYLLHDHGFNKLIDEYMNQVARDAKIWVTYTPEMEQKLKTYVTDAFRKYTEYQAAISKTHKQGVKFGQSFMWSKFEGLYDDSDSFRFLDILENIYKYADDVLKMADNGVDFNSLIDSLIVAKDFGAITIGPESKPFLKELRSYIKELPNSKELYAKFEQLSDSYIETTLSDSLKRAYAQIDSLNNELGQVITTSSKEYWSENAVDKFKHYTAVMTNQEINDELMQSGDLYNKYNWSTQHGKLGTKKLYSQKFIQKYNIGFDEFPQMSNVEYARFYQSFKDAEEMLKNTPIYNKAHVDEIRNCLKEVYKRSDVAWVPRNIDVYFTNMSDAEVMIWDTLTRNPNLSLGLATDYRSLYKEVLLSPKYSYAQRAEYRTDPREAYFEIQDIVLHYELSDSKHIADAIRDALPINTMYNDDCINRPFIERLETFFKDPATFKKHEKYLDNYIRKNVDAYKHSVESLDNVVFKDARPTLNDDVTAHKKLKSYGIDPLKKTYNSKVGTFLTLERADGLSQDLADMTLEQFRTWFDVNQPQGLIFYTPPKNWTEDMPELIANFTDEQMESVGLRRVLYNKDLNLYAIFRVGDNPNPTPTKYKYSVLGSYYENHQQKIDEMLEYIEPYIYNDDLDLPYQYYTGKTITKEFMEHIYNLEQLQDIVSQISYQFGDVFDINNIFKKNMPKPDFMFLGDIDCYNNFLATIEDSFTNISVPRYATNLIDRDMWAFVAQTIDATSVSDQMLHLAFNDDFHLGNPMFKQLLDGMSDEELKETFKRHNWVACLLKEDKNGRPKVYKIHISNRKQLADAIAQDAVAVPHEMYRTLVLGVNKQKIDAKSMHYMYRMLGATYKSIYMHTPGQLFRNGIDSVFYKNMASGDGLESIVDTLKYSVRAAKEIEWFEKIQREITDRAREALGIESLKKEYVISVLKELPKEDIQKYIILDMLYKSGAAGGYTEALKEVILKYNINNSDFNPNSLLNLYSEAVFEKSSIAIFNGVNDRIERIARTAKFLNLIDNGLTPTDAIKKVFETHFDYDLSRVETNPLEEVIWFSTFPINNFLFYMNEGLTKNPNMIKFQMDMMELSWNDGEYYTWDDVKNSEYLTYNVMAGNLRINILGKNRLIKTGFSVLDFFSVLANPIGSFTERINPFLAIMLGLEGFSELNPLGAHINRFKQLKEGKSLVPSIYYNMQTFEKYKKAHKVAKHYYNSGRSWTTYPKRIPRIRRRPVKSRFAYTRNWRQYTRYFHRNSNPPEWTYRNSRQHHVPSRYIRNQKIRI